MMKKIYVGILLVLLLTSVFLGACGMIENPAAETERQPPTTSVPPMETGDQTLEALLGEDYVQFLTDTITMQMENRMEKNPEIRYYPVTQQAPLGDYAAIGETTQFEVDAEGNLVIIFPAGKVVAPEHGEQRFRIIRIEEQGELSDYQKNLAANGLK